MGADRVIFGSDWPHIEGMPNPLDYAVEIKELDADVAAPDPARQRGSAERAQAGLKPSNIRRIAAEPCAPPTGVRDDSRMSAAPAAMLSIVASRSTRPCAISRPTLA